MDEEKIAHLCLYFEDAEIHINFTREVGVIADPHDIILAGLAEALKAYREDEHAKAH